MRDITMSGGIEKSARSLIASDTSMLHHIFEPSETEFFNKMTQNIMLLMMPSFILTQKIFNYFPGQPVLQISHSLKTSVRGVRRD
ncbi:hypothetical protein TNCV_3938971 [Trichonephila clavipes]|nr:hypothetical protein TNCV_3938971 [Trichonephila clavipes]